MHNMDKKELLPSLLIGKKIKEIRKSKGITQEKLAVRSNVAYTTFTKIENGTIKNPSFKTIVAIAKELDVNFNELIK